MIAFSCVSCGQALSVLDEFARKLCNCPRCGQVQPVPPLPTANAGDSGSLTTAASLAQASDISLGRSGLTDTAAPGTDCLGHAPPIRSTTAPALTSVQVPGHEILAELGRGGMGVVYKAQHRQLKRLVALKMMLAGNHASEQSLVRFRVEAEAVARIQHPGIVQIHEIGEHNGLPYFSLELCSGGSLADKLDGTPLPPRETAQMVEKLARAIAAAHAQGIVHRDLKPANVLFDAEGEPKITDFGLAKMLDDDQGQTASGAILGTPSYMAPEQASGEGKQISAASDVYALGAILYELLTGRAPFKGARRMETIRQVIADEPVAPSRLQRSTPLDLETICLKCLHKEPARRYATAQDLAEDLGRFRRGEPVRARPIGRLEKTWRWCRRNPLVAGSLTGVGLALLTAALISVFFALRAEQARQAEADRARSEETAKREAESARQSAQRQLIDLCSASGLAAAGGGDHSLALLWFARAVQQARQDPQRQDLNRIRMTNWLRQVSVPEGSFTVPGFRPSQDRFQAFAFSPDGTYLLVTASTGECLVWNRREGRLTPLPPKVSKGQAAAWEPRTGLLAVAHGKRIHLLSPPDFRSVEEVEAGSTVTVLAFTRDGKRLAWGGANGARVWDRDRKDHVSPFFPHGGAVRTLAFSTSGNLVATSAEDGNARVFRVDQADPGPLFPPIAGLRPEHGMAHGGADRVAPRFTGDERFLLTAEGRQDDVQRLVWRSAVTGKLWRHLAGPPGQPYLTAFAVNRRGDRVAALWDSSGRILDARTGGIVAAIPTEKFNWCEDVVFSADGKTLATCGHDMMAQTWAVNDYPNFSLVPARAPIFHSLKLVRVDLSADGGHLATAQWDGTVCLWRFPRNLSPAYALNAGGVTLPALSPDGRFVLPRGTTYKNGTQRETRVYEARTGKPAGPPLDPGGILLDATFSPDGKLVATSGSSGTTSAARLQKLFLPTAQGGGVQLWDWRSGKRLVGPIRTPGEPRGLAFSPDGRLLAVVCADYHVLVLDPRTGAIRHRLHPGVRTRPWWPNLWWGNGEARFSPDGRFLVTWELANPVHVWDPQAGRLLHTLPHTARVEGVAFNPRDPAQLVTVGRGSVARTWDLNTGQLLQAMQHPQHLNRVQFSPDGAEIITACADGRVRVWDARQGTLHHALAPHSGLMDIAFTADRRWLVTLATDSLQVTDWRTRTATGPVQVLPGGPHLALSIPAGDDRVIVSGFTRSLMGYDLKAMLTPMDTPADTLVELAELVAGRRILNQGNIVPLTSPEWLARWRRLNQGGHVPPLTSSSP